jgi:hypothetical protein
VGGRDGDTEYSDVVRTRWLPLLTAFCSLRTPRACAHILAAANRINSRRHKHLQQKPPRREVEKSRKKSMEVDESRRKSHPSQRNPIRSRPKSPEPGPTKRPLRSVERACPNDALGRFEVSAPANGPDRTQPVVRQRLTRVHPAGGSPKLSKTLQNTQKLSQFSPFFSKTLKNSRRLDSPSPPPRVLFPALSAPPRDLLSGWARSWRSQVPHTKHLQQKTPPKKPQKTPKNSPETSRNSYGTPKNSCQTSRNLAEPQPVSPSPRPPTPTLP